jgi:hypothetical protein
MVSGATGGTFKAANGLEKGSRARRGWKKEYRAEGKIENWIGRERESRKLEFRSKCREMRSRVSNTADGVRDMMEREMKYRNKTSRNKEKWMELDELREERGWEEVKSRVHGKVRKLEEQRGGIGNVWKEKRKSGNHEKKKETELSRMRKQADNMEEGNQKGNEKMEL